MNRRSFLGFLGTAPVAVPVIAKALTTDDAAVVRTVSKRLPAGTPLVTDWKPVGNWEPIGMYHKEALREFRETNLFFRGQQWGSRDALDRT